MRILISCLQSVRDHDLPPYQFWRSYFKGGCEEAGIECVEVPGVDWAEGLVYSTGHELETWRERTWEIVLDFARREHLRRPIDYFLSYLFPKQIEVAAIEQIQSMGIPAVNFFCDNLREFREAPAQYKPFALHWVPEFEALPIYRNANLPHLHLPMPCWVPQTLRVPPTGETEPPTFIGTADVLRRDVFGRALRAGADVIVRGRGWTCEQGEDSGAITKRNSIRQKILNQFEFVQSHGAMAFLHKLDSRFHPIRPLQISCSNIRKAPTDQEEYFQIIREAMVAIGVNRVPTPRISNRNPLTFSRLRDIEAPMLGACYLTEWTKGLETLYDLGNEIETYRSPEELSEKLSALKRDPQRRRTLRSRGQRRALSEHCVGRSMDRIADRLGLSVMQKVSCL